MIDRLSEYLAQRKGLIPMLGVVLILLNFALQFLPGIGVIATSNLLLHLGVVLAVIGLLLARAL